MKNNKTLIIGASTKPERYSYKAAQKLLAHKHGIYMIANRAAELFDLPIEQAHLPYEDVDTVTMYISAKHQPAYYDYIISLQPRRVIFNPGTENPEFELQLSAHGIASEVACTLVLLATNAY